jgi:hypothetical protein
MELKVPIPYTTAYYVSYPGIYTMELKGLKTISVLSPQFYGGIV